MFKLKYQTKLKLFSIFTNFFKKFNLHIFYYKKKNYLKDFKVDNIIDIGVARGTDFLLQEFPKAKFFFIEPNPLFFNFIEDTLLKKYNSKLFKIAAGNESGLKKLWSSDGFSSFYERQDYKFKEKIEVNISKLDEILKNESLNGKNLLKIDTEGFELEVLKGATKTLESISYLVLELRIENINTYNPSEIISFLYNKNFIFYKIIKISYTKNGISYMDVIFIKNKI